MTTGNPFLDRLNHPIFGTFIASWTIWNWELVYCISCGIKTPKETIDYVHAKYLIWSNGWNLTALPLGITLVYLYGGPLLKKGYDISISWIMSLLDKLSPRLEKDFTALQKHHNREMGDLRENHARIVSEKNHEIDTLTVRLGNYKHLEVFRTNHVFHLMNGTNISAAQVADILANYEHEITNAKKDIADRNKAIAEFKKEVERLKQRAGE